jgi:mono/diheme cytochrome c family protein
MKLSVSLCLIVLCVMTARGAQNSRSVWDGVFTEEQSQRGRAIYLQDCSNCHAPNLEGADMTPGLTGPGFMSNWDGLSVGDLADRIRISMPLNAPGTLSRQDNADIVAYILHFNQFPAGKQELPRESAAMRQIVIKASRS